MSPEALGIICVLVMLFLMYAGMWVGLALFFVGFWGIVAIAGWNVGLEVLATVPYRSVGNYTISMIPLFSLMGAVAYNTGLATELFYSANKWLGQLRGGLAMASSLACAILGVITDSIIAVITLGRVAVPEMKKYGYDESLATGSIVSGGSLASLIPPSIGFVLYGVLTETSVGALFIAGIIPGILLVAIIILIIDVRTRVNPNLAPAGPKTSFKEKIVSLKYTWSMGLLVLLIVGGIYVGIFTPTESGGIGAFGAIVIAMIARRLTKQNLLQSVLETAQITAMIVLLIASAFTFMKLIALSRLPFTVVGFVVGLGLSKYIVLILIIFVHIILGMFCDIMSAILLTIPIFFPIIVSLGFDPIWWGVIMVIIMETGVITPPYGMNVFVLSGITGTPVGTIFRGVWPFVAALLALIVILTIFPQIVLFLPSTM